MAGAIATTGLAKTAEIVQSMFIGHSTRCSRCSGPTRLPSERRQRRQPVGLGIMRYGVRSESLHSMSVEMLVDAIRHAALPGRRYRRG